MKARAIMLAMAVALVAPAAAGAEERLGGLAAEVLVPDGYAGGDARWPVLYLVPGSGGEARHAIRDLALADWPGRNQAIVVVAWEPGNPPGWNFVVDFRDGSQQLDTDFVEKVIPWVDSHYRTRADAGHRAIAGYSAGGYSAAAVASRHPELFRVMGAFSGVVDLTDRHPVGEWAFLAPFLTDAPSLTLFQRFGDPITAIDNWHAQNPADLAARLRGYRAVYIAAGDGIPADADEAQEVAGNFVVPQVSAEEQIGSMTRAYDARLTEAGVEHVYRPHRGAHSARHWRDDLAAFWPLALDAFAKADRQRPKPGRGHGRPSR